MNAQKGFSCKLLAASSCLESWHGTMCVSIAAQVSIFPGTDVGFLCHHQQKQKHECLALFSFPKKFINQLIWSHADSYDQVA